MAEFAKHWLLNPGALLALALSGIVLVVLWRGFSLFPVTAGALPAGPSRTRFTGWMAALAVMVLAGVGGIIALKPTWEQMRPGLGAFLVLLAGMLSKWIWDAYETKPPTFDTTTLPKTFVASLLLVFFTWKAFSGDPTLHSLLLVFYNGFFWQTIFKDHQRRQRAQRTRERGNNDAGSVAHRRPKKLEKDNASGTHRRDFSEPGGGK